MDGWGISNSNKENVLRETPLPTIEKMNAYYPMTTLQASGISVGLFWGTSGNSEVGHMALGAGKIVYQNLPRITLAIQNRELSKNEALQKIVENVKKNNSSLHLMGLVGEGSVHSYAEHLYALVEFAREQGIANVFIHVFTDGRDSPQTSGVRSISVLENKLSLIGAGKIASLCGRNWAMDRNNNWDRIEKAYRMLTDGTGIQAENPAQCLQESYSRGITDEYIEPSVIMENGKPIATIKDGDSVVFFNFREDRARQLTQAFAVDEFDKFTRQKLEITFATMTEYEKNLPVLVAFPPEVVKEGLGELLSKHKLKQLRIAETEKYAHVTYFFNGGKEDPWPGEDRILVPSPAVAHYDLSPEMSAKLVTEKTVAAIKEDKYDFILINYANADMVGHTGMEQACRIAVQTIDECLSVLIPTVLQKGGSLFITSDHGNIEDIRNYHTGQVDTEHSTNPVPFWYISPTNHYQKTPEEIALAQSEVGGLLSDVAPTILEVMGLEKPESMSGESLLSILK